ncbi:2'-5' RNA ligase family protein [Brunnivagina elsteri]|uniref:2'-5' RNA ligase n=1 Tax=Brunnivagina elsteri CCALA 953 TaxID=987040 RepID=A0A2A2THJ0_9CYAN|nr:2'-5' RNA ligase family protein [Calothrix elsteri]PAX53192.1 2'-5' RNA ligase [Calothrix elsteri CCALA 953]
MTLRRFFIAILPPQHIQDDANQIKQDFAANYASFGAQKSPPHITLQPPFEWDLNDISALENNLKGFTNIQKPFSIRLKNFAAFAPRVIYIDVLKAPELISLQADLMAYLEVNLGIIDQGSKNRQFTPHMTVAFRDLTKQNFQLAWQKYESLELDFEFVAESLTLLLHDGKCWNVKRKFPFCF